VIEGNPGRSAGRDILLNLSTELFRALLPGFSDFRKYESGPRLGRMGRE